MPDKSPLEIIREQIKALLAEREPYKRTMDEVISAVERRGKGVATPDEERRFNAARDAAARINAQLKPLEEQREQMLDAQHARDAAAEASRRYGGSDTPVPVRVTGEPGVYRRGAQHSFFADLVNAEKGDWSARDRLEAHRRGTGAEQRAVAAGGLGGLVPPQFLTDLYAEANRAGRPFLDAMRSLPLPPEGMSLTVPLSATATVVSSQATENTSVTSRDVTTFDLNVDVRTIAGLVDVSRQAIDRGHMTDELIFADLAGAYSEELERQAIAGTGASGEHIGVLSTTQPGSITTVAVSSTNMLLLPRRLADAVQRINSSRFQGADLVVMHPRRWGVLSSVTDSTGRPLFDAMADGMNSAAGGSVAGTGMVGRVLGLPVITSGNVPTTVGTGTNEDVILVCRASELLLWEDPGRPLSVRFDETLSGQLTSKLVAWGYSAFTAGWRVTASAILSGTGLTTPSF